jgi:uncharacterized protein
MRPVRILAVALLILAAAAIAGIGRPEAIRSADSDDEEATPQRTITVNGSGTVTTVPDQATFTFGVDVRGQTASEALSEAAKAAGELVDALKREGVDGKDIQTQHVSLSPVTSSDGRHIEGYAAGTSVTVRIDKLDRAGPLVDVAVAAGANNVYGPSLDRSDADELAEQALADGVADARRKGEALATAAGGELGDVVSVTETGGAGPPVPYAREAALSADLPIEPGTQEIQASVTVTFELR